MKIYVASLVLNIDPEILCKEDREALTLDLSGEWDCEDPEQLIEQIEDAAGYCVSSIGYNITQY